MCYNTELDQEILVQRDVLFLNILIKKLKLELDDQKLLYIQYLISQI